MKSQNAILLEDVSKRRKEYATILAFDVKTLPEAKIHAAKVGVKIIDAEIIYHLCDKYKEWSAQCKKERKDQTLKEVVFPCILKPITFFNKKDPIVMGCNVKEGVLKINTPICVYKGEDKIVLGNVVSIEANHKPLNEARSGAGDIAVKIKAEKDHNYTAGRTFDLDAFLYSSLTRKSIDTLKNNFRDEMSEDDWDLVRKLKAKFEIF